jgi:hypothetical protein
MEPLVGAVRKSFGLNIKSGELALGPFPRSDGLLRLRVGIALV